MCMHIEIFQIKQIEFKKEILLILKYHCKIVRKNSKQFCYYFCFSKLNVITESEPGKFEGVNLDLFSNVGLHSANFTSIHQTKRLFDVFTLYFI